MEERIVTGKFEGRVAAITGGVSGIGLATVKRFLEEGAKVVIGDVQAEPGARLEDELGNSARFQLTDVEQQQLIGIDPLALLAAQGGQ